VECPKLWVQAMPRRTAVGQDQTSQSEPLVRGMTRIAHHLSLLPISEISIMCGKKRVSTARCIPSAEDKLGPRQPFEVRLRRQIRGITAARYTVTRKLMVADELDNMKG